MIISIGAAFYRCFFHANQMQLKSFQNQKKKKDWLEKSFDRKPALIEVIM